MENLNLVRKFFTTDELVKDDEMSNFMSVFPNQLGINLCSVEGIEFVAENDEFGQLKEMKIVFRPHTDKTKENLEVFKKNNGLNWADWMTKVSRT